MLTLGREWVSGSSCVSGWRPQQDFSKGMLPEGILCGHRLVCQHCTLLGARANAPARFVPRLGGPVHSRPLLCTRHESWEGTQGGPGCQTIPPAQHPHQGSMPVPLLSTVTPVSPHTPGKLPYLRGAELGHADRWFVPKAAAKHWQSHVQVRWVAHGGRGTRGIWMSPCLGHYIPVTGLVSVWDSRSGQPHRGWAAGKGSVPVQRHGEAEGCDHLFGLLWV